MGATISGQTSVDLQNMCQASETWGHLYCECFWHVFADWMIWRRTFHNTCTCKVVLRCEFSSVGSGWPIGGRFCHKIDTRGGGRYFLWLMGFRLVQNFLEILPAFLGWIQGGKLLPGVLTAWKSGCRNPRGCQGLKGWSGMHSLTGDEKDVECCCRLIRSVWNRVE